MMNEEASDVVGNVGGNGSKNTKGNEEATDARGKDENWNEGRNSNDNARGNENANDGNGNDVRNDNENAIGGRKRMMKMGMRVKIGKNRP